MKKCADCGKEFYIGSATRDEWTIQLRVAVREIADELCVACWNKFKERVRIVSMDFLFNTES